jgi:hypothetical protein
LCASHTGLPLRGLYHGGDARDRFFRCLRLSELPSCADLDLVLQKSLAFVRIASIPPEQKIAAEALEQLKGFSQFLWINPELS